MQCRGSELFLLDKFMELFSTGGHETLAFFVCHAICFTMQVDSFNTINAMSISNPAAGAFEIIPCLSLQPMYGTSLALATPELHTWPAYTFELLILDSRWSFIFYVLQCTSIVLFEHPSKLLLLTPISLKDFTIPIST